jgi:hypothetical protein
MTCSPTSVVGPWTGWEGVGGGGGRASSAMLELSAVLSWASELKWNLPSPAHCQTAYTGIHAGWNAPDGEFGTVPCSSLRDELEHLEDDTEVVRVRDEDLLRVWNLAERTARRGMLSQPARRTSRARAHLASNSVVGSVAVIAPPKRSDCAVAMAGERCGERGRGGRDASDASNTSESRASITEFQRAIA